MKNRLVVLTSMLAIASGATSPSPASAAEGDTRPCVTVGEYRLVNPHTGGSAGTRRHIKRVFDSAGTVIQHNEWNSGGVTHRVQWRRYDRCGTTYVYRIEYHNRGTQPFFSYWG